MNLGEFGEQIAEENLFMKWRHLYAALSITLLASCGQSNEPSQQFEELSFAVDKSLLGPSFTDSTLGFSFHPPMGWEKVPDTTMVKARETLSDVIGQESDSQVSSLRFFINLEKGSSCVLSRLLGLDLSGQVQGSLEEFESQLRDKFPGANVKKGAFRIDDLKVFQFLVTDDQRVIFKLVCWGSPKQIIQVDYVVPRSVYRQQIKAIESSIGSFRLLP